MKKCTLGLHGISTLILLCFCLSILPRPIYATELTEPALTATAGLVVEASTGKILYSKNPDQWLVPASFTKVMTAYIVFEELYAGNLTMDTQVPITKAHSELYKSFYNMSKEKYPAYTTISVEQLLQMILIPSSCAACIIIADYIAGSEEAFVARMNETAQRLSMDAKYENCHGMWVHYLTPRAQARLLQVFIQQFPQVLGFTALTSTTYNGVTHNATNLLVQQGNYYYPDADGFKTGSTQAAGYNLSATASRDGIRVISVVMNGSGNAACFGGSVSLLDYGFARMSTGETAFQDTSYHPQSADLFEKYRKLGVNLQCRNGWVRPIEEITRGEFALLLVELLEVQGYIPTVTTAPSELPYVADLQNYFGEEQILRGVALGLFPFAQNSDSFSPNNLLTTEEMEEVLTMTKSVFVTVHQDVPPTEQPPEQPEQAPEQPEQQLEQWVPENTTPQTDAIPGVGNTADVESTPEEVEKVPIRWAVLSAEQNGVLRGEAILAIEERLFS